MLSRLATNLTGDAAILDILDSQSIDRIIRIFVKNAQEYPGYISLLNFSYLYKTTRHTEVKTEDFIGHLIRLFLSAWVPQLDDNEETVARIIVVVNILTVMTNVLLVEPDATVQERYLDELVAHCKFALERAGGAAARPGDLAMTSDLGQTASMTLLSKTPVRRIDHLVLPTADLEVARDRLTALGFTVAPNALHPFGTHNACVFFADDTYLEPMAVKQRETYEEAARKGNVFLLRDEAYRFRRGEDGFSALVMATDDAAGDQRQFVDSGISAGNNLTFSRDYATVDGDTAEARFELAFAADLRAPDVFFFTCQRLRPLKVDRSRLESHENGVTGMRQVVLSEKNPSDFQYLLQEVANQREVTAHSFGLEIKAGNADIAALNPAGLSGFWGIEGGTHGRGLHLRAVVLTTNMLDRVPEILERADFPFDRVGARIVVPAAPGQGAVIAFEAA